MFSTGLCRSVMSFFVGGLRRTSPTCRSFCKRLPKLAVNIRVSSVRDGETAMQQLQFVSFALAMAALVVWAGSSRGNQEKSCQRKPCGQRCRTNVNPAASLSKKNAAAVGRAAACRSSKKLGRACDQVAHARRGAADCSQYRQAAGASSALTISLR
jgi:hypothetical protein